MVASKIVLILLLNYHRYEKRIIQNFGDIKSCEYALAKALEVNNIRRHGHRVMPEVKGECKEY